MKTNWILSLIATSLLMMTSVTAEARSIVLGATGLSSSLDFDDVNVQNACGITRMQLHVIKGSAQIEHVHVVFGNGETQVLTVREHFRQGSQSRWIDLNGAQRCIDRIRILGRSTDHRPRDTRIRFIGDQTNNPQHQGIHLGATTLSNYSDFDLVHVPRTCGITRIKLVATRGAANIQYLSVRFANGTYDRLEVRENFRPGTESRWIDLAGGSRCIEQIQVFGQSSDHRPGETRIDFYGLR